MQIVTTLFGILGIVAGIWAVFGIPIGVILGIIYLLSNNQVMKRKLKKWLKISFGGVGALLLLLILWALINFLGTIFGVQVNYPIPENL
jgi:hypothetical protein